MTFMIVLICVVVAVLLLKPAIKKAPAIWYAAAIALALLYIGVLQGLLPLPAPVRNVLFLLLQKGTLAVALFTVVMFVGVFPRDSKPRKYLSPIRAELSIIACMLIVGHILAYCLTLCTARVGRGCDYPVRLCGLGRSVGRHRASDCFGSHIV